MGGFTAKICGLCVLVLFYSCSKDKHSNTGKLPSNKYFELFNRQKPSFGKDPFYPYSWHLKNTGQMVFSKKAGTPGVDINVEEVWKMGITGKGVRIAVSDSGLDTLHEEFRGQLLDGEHKNYYTLVAPWLGDPSQSDDDARHGTGVTGLIVMAADNGKGSRGVAYGAKVAALAGGCNNGDVVLLDQAQGDFDIFNYSWGGLSCKFGNLSMNYIKQLKNGVKNLRQGKGAIYIKAAGNDFLDFKRLCEQDASKKYTHVLYIGNAGISRHHAFPWKMVVGSVNANGTKAFYSVPGAALWVSAPGGEIVSDEGILGPSMLTTDFSGCDQGYHSAKSEYDNFGGELDGFDPACNYTSLFSGTSSAASVTTGVVALILQANPDLTWRDVKHILALTSRKVDSDRTRIYHPLRMDLDGHQYQQVWVKNAAGYSFHNWYGFGMVDALAAVKEAQNYTTDLGTFVESGWTNSLPLDLAIPDNSAVGITHALDVAGDWAIEAVQIKVTLTHQFIGEIGIELSSPSGTKSIIMPINSLMVGKSMDGTHLLSNAFYGERTHGKWTLKVIDPKETQTGTLKSWSIKFFGH